MLVIQRVVCHRTSRPEALGSLAGYVVPQVIAYYGLIRDSGRLPPTYALYGGSLWPHYFPRETRGSPIYSARLYPRAALRTPVDCAIAHDCYFIAHTSLRHFRIGSASTCPQNPVHCGVCNEAASFALCYGPSGLLAPPGQDFYFRAFISGNRSPEMSSITTWAYSQFP